jgi:hypothetical protein
MRKSIAAMSAFGGHSHRGQATEIALPFNDLKRL